jgi:hypothetical protein
MIFTPRQILQIRIIKRRTNEIRGEFGMHGAEDNAYGIKRYDEKRTLLKLMRRWAEYYSTPQSGW